MYCISLAGWKIEFFFEVGQISATEHIVGAEILRNPAPNNMTSIAKR